MAIPPYPCRMFPLYRAWWYMKQGLTVSGECNSAVSFFNQFCQVVKCHCPLSACGSVPAHCPLQDKNDEHPFVAENWLCKAQTACDVASHNNVKK
ncbi:hypothetical protein [Desulfobulbus oralis]|uniref:hypothetical protein n=1 Tax=Desulfobulbus oralis TaxID=1986146 RepID=UPI0015E31E88|nr:hypothetical protein [Desulfobulbus oralis]